jgi:proteasome lid subunit RPN8/RPN11
MNQMMITQAALAQMWQVSQNCLTETGGLLIGSLHTPLILAAGKPGAHAIHKATFFQSDPQQDKMELQKARQRFGAAVQPVGYWHKHPQGMPRPSEGDLRQAQQMLASWRFLGEKDPWLVCVILQDDQNTLAAAHPYRLNHPNGRFAAIDFQVIPEDDGIVAQTLAAQPVHLESNQREHPWVNPDFHFQETISGRMRLERETQALQKLGYRVEIQQGKSNKRICVSIRAVEQAYDCLLPAEYPLGMPRIFQYPGGQEVYPITQHPVWNSDVLLADWISRLNEIPEVLQPPVVPLSQPARAVGEKNANPSSSLWAVLWASVLVSFLSFEYYQRRKGKRRQR